MSLLFLCSSLLKYWFLRDVVYVDITISVAFVLALIYAVVVWAVEPRAPAPAVMDVDAEDGDETEPLVPQLVDI